MTHVVKLQKYCSKKARWQNLNQRALKQNGSVHLELKILRVVVEEIDHRMVYAHMIFP